MANKEVFYQVVSGDKILPVYDVDAHNRIAAEGQELDELSDKVTTLSGEVKTTSGALHNEITAVNQKVETLSGEVADISANLVQDLDDLEEALSVLDNTVSAHIDDSVRHITSQERTDWNKNIEDLTELSGKHKQLVEDVNQEFAATSAWALSSFQPSGDYVESDEFDEFVDDVNANFSAVQDALDEKLDITATTDWDITPYEGSDFVTVQGHTIYGHDWSEDIGEALEDYYDKDESDERFQPVGDYVSASELDNYYTKSDIDTNFYTTADIEDKLDELDDDIRTDVENRFFNTTLVAGKGIDITQTTDVSGDIEYEVAMKDPDTILNWARFNSSPTAYTTGTTATLAFTSAEGAGTNITLNGNDQVVLDKGSYHVDIQVIADISGGDVAYYDAGLSAGSTRAVMQSIDGSYAHTETLDLSFDVRIQNDGSVLNFELAGLPPCTYAVQNMNIHEFLTLEAAQEAAAGAYNAGQGLSLDPATNTFDVNVGDGLEIKTGNVLQVKLGDGLAFTDDHGIKAISIDPEGEVEQVVESVQKMEADLDTKVTVNYQPSQITTYTDFSTAGEVNNGELLGFLFSVPINNKIYLAEDDEKYITHIGVYSHQTYNQNYVMLGLYEFQPDYPQYINDDPTQGISAYGRTVPLCDTGRVTLSGGFNEFPIKHTNSGYAGNDYTPETTKELKSNCMYYAAIFIPKQAGNGVELASCPNYNVNFNTTPQISTNQTNITATLSSDAVSFNDIGFGSWAGGQNYHEWPSAPRLWMQIRNKERPKN